MTRAANNLPLRLRVIEVAVRSLLPLLGAALLSMGLIGLVSFGVLPLVESFVTRDWIAVEARVETVRVTPASVMVPLPLDRVEVRYAYEVHGQEYESARFGLHKGLESHKRSSRFVDAVAEGASILVWVDGNTPTRAIMHREINWVLAALALPAVLCLVLGAVMVLAGMLLWSDRRSMFRERDSSRLFTQND